MFVFPNDDDLNKEEEQDNKNNFEWKNKGFDTKEKLTLKINVKEANRYEAKKKNAFQKGNPQNLPKGINNLRKKIRDVYDEDDEDDWGVVIPKAPDEYDNTLMRALDENEKKALEQKQTMHNVKMNQTAGKMEAMAMADRVAKEVGLKGVNKKELNENMQSAIFNPEQMQKKILQKDVMKKKGIHGDVSVGELIQTARGIKRVEQMGGDKALKGMESKDVKRAGDEKTSKRDVARLILEKSGQKVDRKTTEKVVKNSSKDIKLQYLADEKDKARQNTEAKRQNIERTQRTRE